MDDPNLSGRNSIGGLSSFIFIGILLISIKLMDMYPMVVLGNSILMFLLGASALVFTSTQLKRLRPIYDYKSIVFWGRTLSGRSVRDTFTLINIIGLWLVLSGAGMACLSYSMIQ
jgi:hypothetical protein